MHYENEQQRASKPSYLGLLNAIAVGEQEGYQLLDTWAQHTSNAQVRAVLEFVAVREQEHAAAFAKRIAELGFSVRPKPSERFAKNLRRVAASLSDQEKFERVFKLHKGKDKDKLEELFDDPTIDPQTGALLGRFIAEERDSARRLRDCYQALLASPQERDEEPVLKELGDKLDRLSATISELKQLRAQE